MCLGSCSSECTLAGDSVVSMAELRIHIQARLAFAEGICKQKEWRDREGLWVRGKETIPPPLLAGTLRAPSTAPAVCPELMGQQGPGKTWFPQVGGGGRPSGRRKGLSRGLCGRRAWRIWKTVPAPGVSVMPACGSLAPRWEDGARRGRGLDCGHRESVALEA